MIVFIKEKLVILSAPKTGTTSLQAALEPHASIMFRDPPGVKHINLAKYQRQIRKMLENLSDGPFETFWNRSTPSGLDGQLVSLSPT